MVKHGIILDTVESVLVHGLHRSASVIDRMGKNHQVDALFWCNQREMSDTKQHNMLYVDFTLSNVTVHSNTSNIQVPVAMLGLFYPIVFWITLGI